MNDKAALRQTITNHFNLSELTTVIHDMGVDSEDISGGTLSNKALNTVSYFKRHQRLQEFAKILAKRKPAVDFSRWGAPLPIEGLHGVLRQLLVASFSTPEIRTLAFDLFPNLYGELEASSGKTRKIEIVVEAAIKNDGVIGMMEYVRLNNPYRYSEYLARVDKALSAYQQRDQAFVPVVPIKEGKPTKRWHGVNDAILLALKMYASGLDDSGNLAKEALSMLGESIDVA